MSTRRIPLLAFGALSYAAFFATFLYAIGFVANIVVPKSLDSGAAGPWPVALAVDLVLLAIFALQHSIMARPVFKRWLTRFVPVAAERSVYVLASSLAFASFSTSRPSSSTGIGSARTPRQVNASRYEG